MSAEAGMGLWLLLFAAPSAAVLLLPTLGGCSEAKPPPRRSGVGNQVFVTCSSRIDACIYEDASSGCQYLSGYYRPRQLTPRLGRDGRPMCNLDGLVGGGGHD